VEPVVVNSSLQRHKRAVSFSPAPTPEPADPSDSLSSRTPWLETASQISAEEKLLVEWIFQQFNLNPDHYRARPIHRRIRACLRAVGATTCTDAQLRLIERPQLLGAALGALLIGTTSFFRDRAVFDDIAQLVLPEIRTRCSTLSVWSAGCSDGAELYSVAALLDGAGMLSSSRLLGTDCRSAAVERARAGYFHPARLADLPHELLASVIEPSSHGPRIASGIRAAIDWRQNDVMSCCDVAQWDLILCRNLLIYLQPHAVKQLLSRLRTALKPGGFLVLGTAEHPSGGCGFVRLAPCIYQREGNLA
jgi:chemotaxis methyl-accepting protein methylase